jgi:predicted RNA-binding Zn-ribbon protein involved in translation (DUF1610 family)
MAFQQGTQRMTCPECGAEHDVPWDRIPLREPFHLTCRACGGVLAKGKGIQDFGTPRLVKYKP